VNLNLFHVICRSAAESVDDAALYRFSNRFHKSYVLLTGFFYGGSKLWDIQINSQEKN